MTKRSLSAPARRLVRNLAVTRAEGAEEAAEAARVARVARAAEAEEATRAADVSFHQSHAPARMIPTTVIRAEALREAIAARS